MRVKSPMHRLNSRILSDSMTTMTAIALGVCCFVSAGCRSLNQSNYTRAGELRAVALHPEPLAYQTEPSLTGVDRSNWGTTLVRATAAETEYRPVYVGSIFFGKATTPRVAGEYPTLQSALMINWEPRRSGGNQWWEAAIDPWIQLGNYALIPARGVYKNRPTMVKAGPKLPYQMVPRTESDVHAVTPE